MMYRLVFLIIQFLNVLYIVPFWSRPSLSVDANRSAYYHHASKPFSPTSSFPSSSLLFSSNLFKKLSRPSNSESDLNRSTQSSLTRLLDSVFKIKSSQSGTSSSLKGMTSKCSPKARHHHHNSVHVAYFAQDHHPLASRLHPQTPLSLQLSSHSTVSSSPYRCTNHRPTHLFKPKLSQRVLTSFNRDIKQRHSSLNRYSTAATSALPFPLDFKNAASIQTTNLNLPPIILPIYKSVSLSNKENIPTYSDKEPLQLDQEYDLYEDKDWSNPADNDASRIKDSHKVTSDDETINTQLPEIVSNGGDIEYHEQVFSEEKQAKLNKNAHIVGYSRPQYATNPSHISPGLAYSKSKSILAQPASHYLDAKLLFPETATKSGHLMLEMAQHLNHYPQHNSKLEASRNKPHPHHSQEELYISTKEEPYTKRHASKELKHPSPHLIKSKLPLPSNRPLYLSAEEDRHLKSSTQSGYLMLEMTQHTLNDSQSKVYFLKRDELVDKQPKLDYSKSEIPHSSSPALYHSKLHSNQSKGEVKAPKIELFQHSPSNMSSENVSPKVHYSQSEPSGLKSTASKLVKQLSPRVVYADSESSTEHKKEQLNTESDSKVSTEANYSKIILTKHSPSTAHHSHPKSFQTQEPSYSIVNIKQDNLPKVGLDEPFYSKQKEMITEPVTKTGQLYSSEAVTQSGYLMLEMTQHLLSNNKPASEPYQAQLGHFDNKMASNYEKLKAISSPVTLLRDEAQITYVQPKLSLAQTDSHSFDEIKSFDSELSAKSDYSRLKAAQNTPKYMDSKLGYSGTRQQVMMPAIETESKLRSYSESGRAPDYSKLARIKIPASAHQFSEPELYKQLSKLESPFDDSELPYFPDHKVLDNQEAPFIKSEMLYSKPEVSSQKYDRSQVHYVHYDKEEEEDDDDEEEEEAEEEEANDEREGELEVEDSDMLAEE